MAIQSRIAAVTGANKGIGLAIGIISFLPSNL
jgi:NAD(P)-dependent dehydrogenase (short-subunit alcohol dehydrogenase family)